VVLGADTDSSGVRGDIVDASCACAIEAGPGGRTRGLHQVMVATP